MSTTTTKTTPTIQGGRRSNFARLSSALLYGLVSIAIMLLNKQILSVSHFPSPLILGFGQMIATILIFKSLSASSLITPPLPPLSRNILTQTFPLPLFYLSNMLFGLIVTQELSLPMLTVLRRFSILFTMILQALLLHHMPSTLVALSVGLMMLGSFLAAVHDLSFNLFGYAIVMLNNVSTALTGVITKKKLTSYSSKNLQDQENLGPCALAYYNSLLCIGPMLVLLVAIGEFGRLEGYSPSGWFYMEFGGSCALGCLLIYSSNLCTQMNSPLDTNIIGCIKNIFVTYIGMVFGGDYVFSGMNFLGINISIFGSLLYTYISFFNNRKKRSPSHIQENQVGSSTDVEPLIEKESFSSSTTKI